MVLVLAPALPQPGKALQAPSGSTPVLASQAPQLAGSTPVLRSPALRFPSLLSVAASQALRAAGAEQESGPVLLRPAWERSDALPTKDRALRTAPKARGLAPAAVPPRAPAEQPSSLRGSERLPPTARPAAALVWM